MADFCLDCYNKIHNTNLNKQDVIEEFGICEECGELKNCIVDFRGWTLIDIVYRLIAKIKRG